VAPLHCDGDLRPRGAWSCHDGFLELEYDSAQMAEKVAQCTAYSARPRLGRPAHSQAVNSVAIVPLAVAMVFVVSVSMAVPGVAALVFVVGDVFVVIPIVLDEVDGAAAGVVFGAVFVPVLFVAGRDVEVDGGS